MKMHMTNSFSEKRFYEDKWACELCHMHVWANIINSCNFDLQELLWLNG